MSPVSDLSTTYELTRPRDRQYGVGKNSSSYCKYKAQLVRIETSLTSRLDGNHTLYRGYFLSTMIMVFYIRTSYKSVERRSTRLRRAVLDGNNKNTQPILHPLVRIFSTPFISPYVSPKLEELPKLEPTKKEKPHTHTKVGSTKSH